MLKREELEPKRSSREELAEGTMDRKMSLKEERGFEDESNKSSGPDIVMEKYDGEIRRRNMKEKEEG